MSATTTSEPTLRPGERLLADGTVWVFNSKLQLDAIAREVVEANVGADLHGLSDEALSGLLYDSLRVLGLDRTDAQARQLGNAVAAERARRDIDTGGARFERSFAVAA